MRRGRLKLQLDPALVAQFSDRKWLKSDVTPDICREFLSCDELTGLLHWRQRHRKWSATDVQHRAINAKLSGKLAFTNIGNDGYYKGRLLNFDFKAHRVAFAIVHGFWPEEVDHINHVRTDNRLVNLRDVTSAENRKNQTARKELHPNIKQMPNGRWRVGFSIAGKHKYLGTFDKLGDAILARSGVLSKMGYHENHGKRIIA